MPATVENRTNAGGPLAGPLEQVGPGDVGQRLVVLEEAVRAVAAGVHHPLGDPLVVEVEDLLPEVEVLQQRRAALADPQRVLVVGDRHALLRRQGRAAIPGLLMGLPAAAPPDPLIPVHGLAELARITSHGKSHLLPPPSGR